MTQIDLERPKARESLKPKFARYAPLVSAALALGIAAMPALGEAQGRGSRSAQCSASVQSGTIPAFTSHGSHVLLLNAPLIREGSYLSVSLPDSYTAGLVRAAGSRPEAERDGFVADILQNNIQIAYSLLGSRSRVTFSCAPVDGSLPSSATAPVRPSQSAGARPSASAHPPASSSAAHPPASAQPSPSATQAPADQPPAQRRRAIEP
jgi:hypothetical protein